MGTTPEQRRPLAGMIKGAFWLGFKIWAVTKILWELLGHWDQAEAHAPQWLRSMMDGLGWVGWIAIVAAVLIAVLITERARLRKALDTATTLATTSGSRTRATGDLPPDPVARLNAFRATLDGLTTQASRLYRENAGGVPVKQLILDTEVMIHQYLTAAKADEVRKQFAGGVSIPFWGSTNGGQPEPAWVSVPMRFGEWAARMRKAVTPDDMRLDEPEAEGPPPPPPALPALDPAEDPANAPAPSSQLARLMEARVRDRDAAAAARFPETEEDRKAREAAEWLLRQPVVSALHGITTLAHLFFWARGAFEPYPVGLPGVGHDDWARWIKKPDSKPGEHPRYAQAAWERDSRELLLRLENRGLVVRTGAVDGEERYLSTPLAAEVFARLKAIPSFLPLTQAGR